VRELGSVNPPRQEVLMLQSKSRFARNPYFQSHPWHSSFSLISVLVLVALIVWMILLVPQAH
jgi:hypothetical protein